ncbi:MAG: phenylalanine--tRNA ligase subunit beta [Solirubrobacterales bacterium]|nr:phenylalanine--tRNA ligase subunit beta [Solirubrobacterales bacterium]
MKVPLSLLLEFCDPGLSAEEISSVLALSGTEVERVTRLGVEDSSNFVVGVVLTADQHPDADRLKVCTVDVGAPEPATIVCGAPNVGAGQTVAVALPGAVMPVGMMIKKAKLRGVESSGMICAEDELGLGKGHQGILVLAETAGPAGRALGEVLPLDETVLELEITPNRPDCLGVYGVARELHAATGAELKSAPWENDLGSAGALDGIKVSVQDSEQCRIFTARIYEGLSAAVTPPAIAAHLTAAGMRPISPVVDITNYVMLVVGEPLHVFDLDKIDGDLTVRAAAAGETVATLDGESRDLVEGETIIADAGGPTSIAGVMGGARSEVGPDTTRVLLEAATWHGPSINQTSARLGLRSEASGRFEKGLAPVFASRGQAFASQLFGEIYGVAPAAGTVVVGAVGEAHTIKLSHAKVNSLMGSELTAERITGPLERLGFTVSVDGDVFSVEVPLDRLDVARDVDLIEEIARIDGLEKLGATLPTSSTGGGRLTRQQKIRRQVQDALVSSGCFEAAGWSFCAPGLSDRLRLASDDSRRNAITLVNPMSSEESVLRTTLLGSLLDSAARNAARGAAVIRLFETGPVYLPSEDGLSDEPQRFGAVLCGPSTRPDWRNASPSTVDVHAAIGVIGQVLDSLHCEWRIVPVAEPEPFLHPGRSGVIEIAGRPAGWVGDLHPLVSTEWGLDGGVAFEVDLNAVISASPEVLHYSPVSAHPMVGQDLAVVVDAAVSAAELIEIAEEVGSPELESVSVFDIYRGKQLGENSVSVGLRFAFRADDRTLTEEEATAVRQRILEALQDRKGAQSRG